MVSTELMGVDKLLKKADGEEKDNKTSGIYRKETIPRWPRDHKAPEQLARWLNNDLAILKGEALLTSILDKPKWPHLSRWEATWF